MAKLCLNSMHAVSCIDLFSFRFQLNSVDVSDNSQREVIEELERYPDHLKITVIGPPQLPPGLEDSLFKCFSKRFTKHNLVMTATTRLVNDHHFDQRPLEDIPPEVQGCTHFLTHRNDVPEGVLFLLM